MRDEGTTGFIPVERVLLVLQVLDLHRDETPARSGEPLLGSGARAFVSVKASTSAQKTPSVSSDDLDLINLSIPLSPPNNAVPAFFPPTDNRWEKKHGTCSSRSAAAVSRTAQQRAHQKVSRHRNKLVQQPREACPAAMATTNSDFPPISEERKPGSR